MKKPLEGGFSERSREKVTRRRLFERPREKAARRRLFCESA
jgi:hypothetical protein